MSSPQFIQIPCPQCGNQCAIRIGANEIEREFACGACGNRFEFESTPTVDEINKAILEAGQMLWREITARKK